MQSVLALLLQQQLLNPALLTRGIEKESLRMTANGQLAETDHPAAMGAALTNPLMTTDFAESLLELVTPPIAASLPALSHSLDSIQRFAYRAMGEELLWPASMPLPIPDPNKAHLAHYGSSNIAQFKYIYRVGLCHRYGRLMQMIAGIHYNVSFPDSVFQALQHAEQDGRPFLTYRSETYLGLVRNFLRHYWLLPYLFGASPVCSATSLRSNPPEYLQARNAETWVGPYATSLRMSDLGYQNAAQSLLKIDFNSVNGYADSLLEATRTPYPAFSQLGVKVDGEYRQLNDSILQLENEYYSPIRLKRVGRYNQRPAQALKEEGVEYIEVRVLDLNPLLPLGIDEATMAFMDIFLWYCLLQPRLPLDFCGSCEARANFAKVATQGRKPGLQLQRGGSAVDFRSWAQEILSACVPIAQALDATSGGQGYSQALVLQGRKLSDPQQTPSAQVLQELERYQGNYQAFGLAWALRHREEALRRPLTEAELAEFERIVTESLRRKAAMEAESAVSFEAYRERYFNS